MARMRTLKPGFFTNEHLAELEPLARLLFQGLWCLADREGRLEDRPRKIKVEVLPYDECDVTVMLTQLHDAGFITRYEAGGQRYIAINNFSKHQTPHMKEAPSVIPAPGEPSIYTGEHSASTRQAPDKHSASTSGNLVVGSGEWELGSGNLGVGVTDAPAQAQDAERPRSAPKPRATRLPDPYPLPAEVREWAERSVPGLDVDYEHEKFCDYWHSGTSTKTDWVAAERNWLRRAYETTPKQRIPALANGRASPVPLTRAQEREQQILAERDKRLRAINGYS